MPAEIIDFHGYPVHVTRSMSMRRTISIRNGQLYMTAGVFDSEWQIRDMLEKKHHWITNKLNNPLMSVSFTMGQSTSVFYLGRRIGLQFEKASRGKVEVRDTYMIIYGPSPEAMMNAFRKFAAETLDTLIDRFREEINEVGDYYLSYRFYTSRWGCCFKDRRHVIMNLWCVGLPVEGIKYVFCHELAHLKVANHQKAFYRELERIWPQYRQGLKITKSYVI